MSQKTKVKLLEASAPTARISLLPTLAGEVISFLSTDKNIVPAADRNIVSYVVLPLCISVHRETKSACFNRGDRRNQHAANFSTLLKKLPDLFRMRKTGSSHDFEPIFCLVAFL